MKLIIPTTKEEILLHVALGLLIGAVFAGVVLALAWTRTDSGMDSVYGGGVMRLPPRDGTVSPR